MVTPVVPLIPYAVWTGYKFSLWGLERVTDGSGYLVWPWHYSSDVYGEIANRFQVFASLLGIFGDTHLDAFSRELAVFGYGVGDEACGLYHPVPISSTGQSPLRSATTCIPVEVGRLMEMASPLSIYASIVVTVVALIVFSIRLFLRQTAFEDLLMVPAIVLLASYVAISAGISRYSYPLAGLAFCYLAVIFDRRQSCLMQMFKCN